MTRPASPKCVAPRRCRSRPVRASSRATTSARSPSCAPPTSSSPIWPSRVGSPRACASAPSPPRTTYGSRPTSGRERPRSRLASRWPPARARGSSSSTRWAPTRCCTSWCTRSSRWSTDRSRSPTGPGSGSRSTRTSCAVTRGADRIPKPDLLAEPDRIELLVQVMTRRHRPAVHPGRMRDDPVPLERQDVVHFFVVEPLLERPEIFLALLGVDRARLLLVQLVEHRVLVTADVPRRGGQEPVEVHVGLDDGVTGGGDGHLELAVLLRLEPRRRLEDRLLDGDPDLAPLVDEPRSEEHTSELQSLRHLVCRLLLEKKKNF